MSTTRPDIDLTALERPRAGAGVEPPRRRWMRFALPVAIFIAFGGILASTYSEGCARAVPVTTIRPRIAEGASAPAGSVAVQAAGWVEPDPFPTLATALAAGVVREVLVQEAQRVAAGDAVARLVDEDAKIAVASAKAAAAKAEAEFTKAKVEAAVAKESFDAALAVTEADVAAQAELEGKRAAATQRAEAAKRGEATVTIAEQELALARELLAKAAAGPFQVPIAQAKRDEAAAGWASLKAEASVAAAEASAAEARAARARRERELRLDDRLRLETARAQEKLAEAAATEARAALQAAQLRLDRMVVRAPIDGVVLERLTVPGAVLESGAAGSPICSLFDPANVRVRVDIPQGEVAKVSVGQSAQILADVRSGKPYRGEVLRIVTKADIQKVTLQAHVRVADSDGLLRPEMLCQVRFLASSAAASGPATSGSRVWIPSRLLEGDSIWVISPDGRTAARRRVEAGARDGEWVEVLSGVNISDKLIDGGRAGLREGAPVREESGRGAH